VPPGDIVICNTEPPCGEVALDNRPRLNEDVVHVAVHSTEIMSSAPQPASPESGVPRDTPLRLGIVGLGLAGPLMTHAAAANPGIELVAAADPGSAPREAFARDFGARVYADAEQLFMDESVQAVYIGTPHQLHEPHAVAALRHGKHVVVEKPLALTLADCDAIVAATRASAVRLIVGHTHGFDPNVRLIRQQIRSGEFGPLALVALSNYTDFLYRPRRPEELDTALGGGIIYNQLPHQIDIARLLADSPVTRVRAASGVLDPARPTEGLVNVFLKFASGASASILYSGYDFFDSDELHGRVGELGHLKPAGREGAARRSLAALAHAETKERAGRLVYGVFRPEPPSYPPHFGLLTATCARGDLRFSERGVAVYDANGRRELQPPVGPQQTGHDVLLEELLHAVHTGTDAVQNAEWGRATVQVLLAVLQSAREDREISL
jgi:phthalate 4,5-cis-dihydrodiol dehydrogenase